MTLNSVVTWTVSAGCSVFFVFIVPKIIAHFINNKKSHKRAPEPKKYIVRAFSSVQDLEDYINEMSGFYSAVSIADTDRYITVLLKRKD